MELYGVITGPSKSIFELVCCGIRIFMFCFVAATVSFNKSAYRVNEGDGPVQPVLVLSNPSSFAITVQVTDTNNTATGKLHYK